MYLPNARHDNIGGYYRVDSEDPDYEIRIEATDRISGELRESETSIKLNVEDFFKTMGFSDSDSDIEIDRVD